MNTIMTPDNKREHLPGSPKPVLITFEQLKVIVPTLPKSGEVFVSYLNDTMGRYGITTPNRKACFIAQIAHESGGFRYTRELASGKAYEGRLDLGNTQPGDGVFYKGRGLIQITGRANYASLFKDLNIDCLKNPQLLEAPQYATLSAGWFWNKKELNKFADLPDEWRSKTRKYSPFFYITYLINGGLNGIDDRLKYFERAKASFL